MKPILLVCGLAALLFVPAAPSATQPLAFQTGQIQVAAAVSQQPGATNPTIVPWTSGLPCGWDANDYVDRWTVPNSSLAGATSVSDSLCMIQDWSPRTVQTQIGATSPNLIVMLGFSTGGSRTVVPVFDKRLGLWMYRVCVDAPTYPQDDPALAPIAGSSGVGVQTTVTLTVANQSRQSTRISYDWGYWPGAC